MAWTTRRGPWPNWWLFPQSTAYTEVAQTLGTAFRRTAAASGGWPRLADRHLQPGDRFAHYADTITALRAWLLGE